MPIKKCSVDGKSGWKWGDSGHCYTGPDARKRAVAQYQAALANGYQEKSEEMSRLASEIAGLSEPERKAEVTLAFGKKAEGGATAHDPSTEGAEPV